MKKTNIIPFTGITQKTPEAPTPLQYEELTAHVQQDALPGIAEIELAIGRNFITGVAMSDVEQPYAA